MESEEIILLALYKLDVEVNNKQKGRVILEPSGGLYLPGQVVRVETIGFLDRWEGDLAGDKATEEIVMNGHKKVQAYFGGYKIDVEVQPEGGGVVKPEPAANEFGLYGEGQQVLLRAIGNEERDILGWYGEGLDRKEEELEILMDENKKVLAKFSAIPGEIQWKYETGGGVSSSPAIGEDGTVYVGSNDNKLYAVDGETGKHKWEYETGGGVHSSPAIGADGTVYVGSNDKYVYALDGETGEKKWQYKTRGAVSSSPVIGEDRTVYVGSNDNKLYAIDGETGNQKWEYETGEDVRSSPAIGADGTVYVGSNDKYVYALDGETGEKKWRYKTKGAVSSSPAIGSDGTVYVGSDDDKVYALEGQTGEKRWQYDIWGDVKSSPAIGADGTVYVGTNGNNDSLSGSFPTKVYAIKGTYNKNTKEWEVIKKWEYKEFYEPEGDVESSPAIGADGTVYVGTNGYYDPWSGLMVSTKVYAIKGTYNKNTKEWEVIKKWEYETGGEVRSSPAIGADGMVYVGSDDGKVYAIATESEGLARSAWPMFGDNPQRRYDGFKDRLFISGETVVIGYPSISGMGLRWKKDGELLQSNDRISGVDQAYLRIADCNEEDIGRYSVLVDDGAEQYESEEIILLALYKLDVEVNNKQKGRVILEPSGGLYLPGQVVRVETVGFLDRWEGDLAGDKATEEIVMNGHKKVQAYFGGYKIDVEVQPEGGGEVRTEPTANEFGLYEEGQQVLLWVKANKKRNMLSWYGEGLDWKEEELEILMDENKKIMVKLSRIPGEQKWKYETGGRVSSSPAIGEDGTVYVGSNDNKLYAIDGETGKKKWEYETGGAVMSSPAIGLDGTVYVGVE